MDELREMANALWLTPGEIHWDLALYWIFLINIVLLALQPSGSWFQTMLGIIVIVAVVIDKTHAFGYMFDSGRYTPIKCHEEIFFGTYIIRIAMFALPLSIAGSTDSRRARTVGIIAGISGGVYAFTRWFFQQRGVTSTELTCAYLDVGMVAQNVGMILILARLILRNKLRLGAVHRDVPLVVPAELAPDEVEV